MIDLTNNFAAKKRIVLVFDDLFLDYFPVGQKALRHFCLLTLQKGLVQTTAMLVA